MKDFKTIDEQIALLRKRGLVIQDEEKAHLYLLTNNYYNIINGYSKFFPRNGEDYTNGTSFEEVWQLYIFDKELKKAFFESLLNAESHLKASFAHRFAEKFPSTPYAYLHTECYDQSQILSVGNTISQLSGLIKRKNKVPGSSINHYVSKHKDVPIWVLINYVDFGTLRFMITEAQPSVQNAVARDMFHFIAPKLQNATPFDPATMISFIENMNDIRNVCAHNNRLLNFRCRRDSRHWPPLHNAHEIKNNDSRRDVYSVFLSLQCFLTDLEYNTLHNTIRKRMNRLKNCLSSISMNEILHTLGFPEDWHIVSQKIQY